MASVYMNGSRDPDLKRYIRYTEMILDTLWTELSRTPNMTQLPEFVHEWMTIDCLVGRHSTERIREWEENRKEKINDHRVSFGDWITSLDNFPCQEIMNTNNWSWKSVPIDIKDSCISQMEAWIKGEHLPGPIQTPLDAPTEKGKGKGRVNLKGKGLGQGKEKRKGKGLKEIKSSKKEEDNQFDGPNPGKTTPVSPLSPQTKTPVLPLLPVPFIPPLSSPPAILSGPSPSVSKSFPLRFKRKHVDITGDDNPGKFHSFPLFLFTF
jgi:hypothetical protein